jgi:hypothetical protein
MTTARLPDRIVENRTYKDQTVRIDGTLFVRCRFDNCKLIFKAQDLVGFDHCDLIECQWVFDGPAENALLFLSALYRLGPAGQDLVEGIFQSVRTGEVFQGSLLPADIVR